MCDNETLKCTRAWPVKSATIMVLIVAYGFGWCGGGICELAQSTPYGWLDGHEQYVRTISVLLSSRYMSECMNKNRTAGDNTHSNEPIECFANLSKYCYADGDDCGMPNFNTQTHTITTVDAWGGWNCGKGVVNITARYLLQCVDWRLAYRQCNCLVTPLEGCEASWDGQPIKRAIANITHRAVVWSVPYDRLGFVGQYHYC